MQRAPQRRTRSLTNRRYRHIPGNLGHKHPAPLAGFAPATSGVSQLRSFLSSSKSRVTASWQHVYLGHLKALQGILCDFDAGSIPPVLSALSRASD